MNITTLKKVWSKLTFRHKCFSALIVAFNVLFVIDLCIYGLNLKGVLDYIVWCWFAIPLLYSNLTDAAMKQPFLAVKEVYDAEKSK